MKVKAFGFGDGQCGYYGHVRRYNGDVFELAEVDESGKPMPRHPADLKDGATGGPHELAGMLTSFSPKWMKPVDESVPETKPSSVVSRAAARRAALRG